MLSRKSKLVALIFSVVLLTILKYVSDHGAEVLSQALLLVANTFLLITGGLITLICFSLLGTFSSVRNPATFHLLRRISQDPSINFLAGFLVTGYLILVRPSLTSNVPFLPFIEWFVIALTVYVMYTVTVLSTKEFYVSSEGPSWRKHIQEVRRETGRDLIRITSVMEQFVDDGVKDSLLVYLTSHLQRLGETEEDILKTLSPLIDSRKNVPRHKLYFLAFPWTRRNRAVRNKEVRENMLNTLIKKIDEARSE